MSRAKSGGRASSARFQFSMRSMLIAVSLVALVVGLTTWWLRPVLHIEECRQKPRGAQEYLGFRSAEIVHQVNVDALQVRNIATVTGWFSSKTVLRARLFLVESGDVTEGNSLRVGRGSSRLGGILGWEKLSIVFALGETDTPNGRVTVLGATGLGAGGGSGIPLMHRVRAPTRKTFTRTLSPSAQQILYVEGDALPVVDPGMSLDAFVRANRGDYLVVVLQSI